MPTTNPESHEAESLRCPGIGRDEEAPRGAALTLYFNRRPTDGEMRAIHDLVQAKLFATAGRL